MLISMKGEPGGSPAGARLTPETSTFRKQRRAAPPGFFAAEAAGLRWLRVAGGPRVVSVLSVDDDGIELERLIPRGGPTLDAARRFGGALARLHDSLDDAAWGAAPVQPAYFGPLDNPLPMAVGAFDTWVEFYAEARLRVIVEQGLARGVFTPADSAAFDAVCGRLP
ncbi:MAG: hypothetical protein FWG11_08945, partial [Promicromonosporaceae bacterium]|nr:hypothetical protein [Promicromonosporaceae bacterium]